jgi:hypothetical protein
VLEALADAPRFGARLPVQLLDAQAARQRNGALIGSLQLRDQLPAPRRCRVDAIRGHAAQ